MEMFVSGHEDTRASFDRRIVERVEGVNGGDPTPETRGAFVKMKFDRVSRFVGKL